MSPDEKMPNVTNPRMRQWRTGNLFVGRDNAATTSRRLVAPPRLCMDSKLNSALESHGGEVVVGVLSAAR